MPSVPFTVTWVAFVAAIVRTVVPPAVIMAGFAVMVTVATGTFVTVTVALAEALPLVPLAAAVYVVVAAGFTNCVPPELLKW